MATVPVRNLSKYGVLADVDPYNIPPEAWSMAVNVRFADGHVERGPVFRNIVSLAKADPRFADSDNTISGYSTIIVGYLDGSVASISNSTETDISIAGYTANVAEEPYTSCNLGGVYYVNRNDRLPWSLRTSDVQFQELANWDVTWTANLLRSCGGALCAFNITKSGTSYPTMVKTSEFAVADTVPSTWDDTDPTNNATENILAEMSGPITDAQNLGSVMIIYGINEAWLMEADGSEEVWSYRKLPFNRGSINANCSVEVDGRHFVFGLNDLWTHDGVSSQSLCAKRVRKFIYSSIDLTQARRCFVRYNSARKEVQFFYVSADVYAAYPRVNGCNRCATYNITQDTWTFDDLPYVYFAAMANVDTTDTWNNITGTWATAGGTWLDEEASLGKVMVMVGDDDAATGLTRTLYAFDMPGEQAFTALPVNTTATKPWLLERSGIDLDEIGVDLPGYKLLRSLYPQARLEPGATPIEITCGSSDYFNQPYVLGPSQTYDGDTLYKLDFNLTGRWLYMKATGGSSYFRLTGYDADLDVLGER